MSICSTPRLPVHPGPSREHDDTVRHVAPPSSLRRIRSGPPATTTVDDTICTVHRPAGACETSGGPADELEVLSLPLRRGSMSQSESGWMGVVRLMRTTLQAPVRS